MHSDNLIMILNGKEETRTEQTQYWKLHCLSLIEGDSNDCQVLTQNINFYGR